MLGCACNNGMGSIDGGYLLGGWNDDSYPPLAGQSTSPGGDGSYTWSDVFKQGALKGFSIFSARYGGVQPGQYYQTGPNGQKVAYALPQGSNQFGFSNFPGTSGFESSSLVPIIGLGIVGLVVVKAFSGK